MVRSAMTWAVLVGLSAGLGCSSTGSHDSAMMPMHCSKCSGDMKADMTLKCKCGNEVQVGDLKAECPKCNAEVKMSDCNGKCPKCGASMSQANCKVKCPKCGGEAEAKAMACPHCMGEMKK